MSFLGNLLGGLGSIVGEIPVVGDYAKDILSGFSAAEQEQDARNWQSGQNLMMLQKQFEYNSALQDKSQAFASEQAALTRDWNTMKNQMQRAAQAGINPLATLGASGLGSSSAQAASSGASVGLPSVSSVPSGIIDLANLSQVLLNRSTAKKTDKEVSRYDEQIDALLNSYTADINLKKAQEDAQKLANDITRMFGKTKASYECLKLFQSALKDAADGRKADAEAKVARATEKLRNTENQRAEMEIPLIKQRMQKEIELVGAQIETEETKQSLNRSAAALNLSEKEGVEFENRVKAVTAENTEKAQVDMLNELLTDLHKKAKQNKRDELAADIQKWRDTLNDPRSKNSARKRVDLALDWLRQKFGFGVSSNISIK